MVFYLWQHKPVAVRLSDRDKGTAALRLPDTAIEVPILVRRSKHGALTAVAVSSSAIACSPLHAMTLIFVAAHAGTLTVTATDIALQWPECSKRIEYALVLAINVLPRCCVELRCVFPSKQASAGS